MIPSEIAEIAVLICADWATIDDDASREVLAAAQRIYDAGYRQSAN